MYTTDIKILNNSSDSLKSDEFQYIILRPPNEKRILDVIFTQELSDELSKLSQKQCTEERTQEQQRLLRDYFHLGRVLF
jgi:hypothetical protein